MCVCDDLPPAIVPAVHQLVQRLSEYVRARREAALDLHEQGVLAALRAAAGVLLLTEGGAGARHRLTVLASMAIQ